MNTTSGNNYSRPVFIMDDSSVKIQVRQRRTVILMFALVTLLASIMGGVVIGQDASVIAPFSSFPTTTINPGAYNQVVFSQSGAGFGSATANCTGYTGSVNTMRLDNNADFFDIATANSTINKIQVKIQSNNSSAGVAVVAFSSDGINWGNFSELTLPANTSCLLSTATAPAGAKYFRMMRVAFGSYTASGTTGLTVRIYEVYAYVNLTGTPPTVSTTSATPTSSTSADLSGNISSIGSAAVTTRGFAVGTSTGPLSSNPLSVSESGSFGTGTYLLSKTSLSAGTTYYVRAFATNTHGTSYGSEISFNTPSGPPTVTIGSLGTVTTSTAPITGNNVASTGGAASISARGIVYKTSNTAPSIATDFVAPHASGALGNYDITLSGLNPGTTYYAWAYATNSNSLTGYSNTSVTFTTKANYRSKPVAGAWSDPNNWEVFNGSTWVNASVTPTSADGTIEIVANSNISVTSPVTADEITISANGQLSVSSSLTINNGTGTDVTVNGRFKNSGTVTNNGAVVVSGTGTYEHNVNANMLTGFTWNAGSTLEITGITTNFNGDETVDNLTGTYQNLTWNCPSQGNFYIALGNNSISIAGKLKVVNTGSGQLLIAAGTQTTVQAGSYEQTGGVVFVNRNGGGTRTFQVNGDVSITGASLLYVKTVGSTSEGRFIIKGNLSMDATATITRNSTGTAIVEFSGAAPQTASFGIVTGNSVDLVLNNANGLTLLSDASLNGNVTLSNGRINTGAFKLSIPASGSINSVSNLKYINGRLEKGIAAATASKIFEIGDASNYLPVVVDFIGTTNSLGTLTASTTGGDHPDIANSGIGTTRSVNRFFTVSNNGVTGFSSYNITLPYLDGEIDGGANEANFKVRKYSTSTIPTWIAPASSTVNTGANTATGNGFTEFSDFAIGEVTIPTTTSISNVVATYGDGVVTLTAGIIPPTATGLIHFFVDNVEVGTGMNAGGTATYDLDPTGLTVGVHVIRAEYYTDGTYESSISANGELNVQPKELTPVISVSDKVYDGDDDATATVQSLTGIVGSDDVSGNVSSADFDDADAANGKNVTVIVGLSGANAGNYTVGNPVYATGNILKADANISVNGYTGTYDANSHGASGSATGVLSEDLGSGLVLGASFTDAPGGTADWTFTGGTNYNDASGSVNIVINKAEADVSVSGYTGTYDGNAHGATGSATGLGGIDLGAGLTLGASYTNAPGGAANWTFSGGTNYEDQSGSVDIAIDKASADVTVNGYSGVYDGNAHGASGTATGVNGEDLSTGLNFGDSFSDVPGGTADWTFSGGTNYEDQSGTVDIEISKAAATVSVSGYTGTYDGNPHGATGTATGIGGVTLSGLNLGASFTNAPGGTANWSFSNPNYADQSGSASIVINKAALTVNVDNKSKLCGQPNPTFTGTVLGAVAGETLTAVYSLTGATTITATVSGTTIGNYNVNVNNGTLTINGISVDASASSNPVAVGNPAILSASVTPATAGISVAFYLDDVLKGTCSTNAAGIATISVSGLGVEVYRVKAVAGDGCSESIAYVPVYDPNGGFITGGGWILSPAGAYAADLSLAGKANFGFNAKYKKGSTAVDGNTEFQFQAGNLNFKSTQHDAGTLVIAGAKGNFKGVGTINGIAGYSFMVSAVDGQVTGGGGVDKFRIKIWNAGGVVYDNNMGLDDNGVPTTALGGGSIVIHEAAKGGKAAQTVNPDILVTSLDARVFNNPAAGGSAWRIKVLSPDQDHPISLRMVDMNGRPVESRQGISAGSTVEVGGTYQTGMYIAEISQNGQRKLVKLMKQ